MQRHDEGVPGSVLTQTRQRRPLGVCCPPRIVSIADALLGTTKTAVFCWDYVNFLYLLPTLLCGSDARAVLLRKLRRRVVRPTVAVVELYRRLTSLHSKDTAAVEERLLATIRSGGGSACNSRRSDRFPSRPPSRTECSAPGSRVTTRARACHDGGNTAASGRKMKRIAMTSLTTFDADGGDPLHRSACFEMMHNLFVGPGFTARLSLKHAPPSRTTCSKRCEGGRGATRSCGLGATSYTPPRRRS